MFDVLSTTPVKNHINHEIKCLVNFLVNFMHCEPHFQIKFLCYQIVYYLCDVSNTSQVEQNSKWFTYNTITSLPISFMSFWQHQMLY